MQLVNLKIFDYQIPLWEILVIFLLVMLLTGLLVRLMFINQRTFGLVLALFGLEIVLIPIIVLFFKDRVNEAFSKKIANIIILFATVIIPICFISLILPEIRKHLDAKSAAHLLKTRSHNSEGPSSKNKEIIAEAIFELSSKKIGALITIEKYNSLEQFAERAITINSDISKELIHNIFIPNTPLHDGAVIVRDDKIICAGAYFNLTKNLSYEKTTGSRHRAALGVSEVSDSLTIVASEETGDVSVAYGGVLIPISDKNALLNYLDSFAK